MEYQKKRGSYKFTDKKHSLLGILMVVVAILIIVTIGVLSYQSSLSGGNGPLWYGVVSFFAMFASLAAFLGAIFSMKQSDVFYFFPILGAFLNGITFIGLFVVYIIGASI